MRGLARDRRAIGPARASLDATERLLASTRRRLAGTMLGLLIVLLAAVGVTTGLLATRSLDASVDRSLEAASAATLERLGESKVLGAGTPGNGSEQEAGDGQETGASPAPVVSYSDEDDHAPAAADTFFLFLDASGAVVSNPGRVALQGLPDNAAALAAARTGRDLRTIDAGGVRVRLLTVPINVEEGATGGSARTLQSGFVLTLQDEQSNDLLRAVLIVGIAGTLGAAVVTLVVTGRALRPIRSAFERERRFVAAASHELRTPAALIRGTAEVLAREGHVGSEGQPFVADIVAEADRLGALVTELSELASAQARPVEPSRPVDLVDVASDVVHRAMPMAEAAGVRLVNAPGPDRVRVLADRDRLIQVALILIDNAVRYTPTGRTVTVSVAPAGRGGELSVADQGNGISAADQERIFEPFERANAGGIPTARPGASLRDSGGSGLGLAIARAIVSRMGGRIRVDDSPEGGAVFTVSLPLG